MLSMQPPAYPEPKIGHSDNATISQDISNPNRDPRHFADPSGATMKALIWEGKNKVAVRELSSSESILCLMLL